MANLETQILDDIIIKSRRKLLTLGGAALAGLVLGSPETAYAATTYTDADILNFALNLEYLEANFYYLAAFGCTIDKPNAAAIAAGAPAAGIPITGSVGTAGTVSGGSKVPFMTIQVASYANETAIEEGKHVLFLQSALSTSAVAQPAINLGTAWQTLGQAALGSAGAAFSPYATEDTFLVGAYVFEDVGVTAYHGAASLLTSSANLSAAAGILAVEAYHAGLIRTTINSIDSTGTLGLIGDTNSISTLRAALSAQIAAASTYDPSPDDFGLATFSVSLAGTTATATRIVDAAADNVSSFAVATARTTSQILNIVTGGASYNTSTKTLASPATGVFYPAGMNAGPNGFK